MVFSLSALAHGRRAVPAVILVLASLATSCTRSPVPPRQISNSRAGAFEAALAATTDGAVVAWYDMRDGNGEIYMRLVDTQGRPAGPERRLTDDPQESYEASIQAMAEAVAVAWYDKATDGGLTPRLGVWNRDGSNRWVTTLPGPGRNPVLRTDGRQLVVAWIQKGPDESEAVWLGRWDRHGGMLASPRQIGPAHATTWNLNAALDGDGITWVVFDAVVSTRASELFLARIDAHDVSVTRLTADDGHESKYPDIAIAGGRVALTWFDAKDGNTEIYLATAAAADLADAAIEAIARRVTTTAGESIGAYVTWNGDRIGLAWSDNTPGQHEVYFQPFDAAAQPLAEPTRVTSNRTSSLIPAIEPWREGFALAWSEFAPTSGGHDGKSEIAFAILP